MCLAQRAARTNRTPARPSAADPRALRIALLWWLTLPLALPWPLPPTARAGDWPQILGPARNGVAQGESLASRWPAGGPAVQWRRPLGSGYAGPVVVGPRLIVFHRWRDVERVEAVAADTGKTLWQTDFPASYRGGIDPDTGPRCTPVIDARRVFLLGAAGDLRCVALETGREQWSRNVYADYGGSEGYFGAGSTPIVSDHKLLVNVGGRDGAGLAAFDLDSGQEIWTAGDESASYSSPTEITLNGQPRVVFVTRLNVLLMEPATGRILFRFPFGRRGPTVNAATPLVFDDYLFVTASYGVGARLAHLGDGQARIVWDRDDAISSQYATSIYHQGFLYGVHGREDLGVAELRCVEALTGAVRWSQKDFGVAHLILADDKLLMLKTNGQLLLASPSPQQLQQLAAATVSGRVTRALPALSRGRLFLRDNAGEGGELLCLDVASDRDR